MKGKDLNKVTRDEWRVAILGTEELPWPPGGGLGCVANKGVIFELSGRVAITGLSERFFGSMATKGVTGPLHRGRAKGHGDFNTEFTEMRKEEAGRG